MRGYGRVGASEIATAHQLISQPQMHFTTGLYCCTSHGVGRVASSMPRSMYLWPEPCTIEKWIRRRTRRHARYGHLFGYRLMLPTLSLERYSEGLPT